MAVARSEAVAPVLVPVAAAVGVRAGLASVASCAAARGAGAVVGSGALTAAEAVVQVGPEREAAILTPRTRSA